MGRGFNKTSFVQYLWKLRVFFNIPQSRMLCERFTKSSPRGPTPMAAAIFSPLALRLVLHDLPMNYAQIITLYDGEGNVSVRYHVDKFDDFIDLEEADDEDVKMQLFAQSLSGEAKKWYKYLPPRSIRSFAGFQTIFLERWDDKQSPL